MTGDVIKSFLVGLGFAVDDTSLTKFNKSIASATVRVTALYASIQLASAAVVKSISGISEGFEQMGYEFRIIAPAINKVLILRREMLKAYSAAGINITKVVQNSVRLNLSLTKTKFALEALYKSVGSRFFTFLTKQSDLFRQKIYQNMPKIQNALEKLVKLIFKALEATTALGVRLWSILTRVYDFFVKLDKATDGWSTIILGVVAAWKLLNLQFLATPLGMIIAGLVAILALYDDLETYREGGQSFFNWGPVIPTIDAIIGYLKQLYSVLDSIAKVVGNIFLGFYQLANGDFAGFFDSLKEAVNELKNTLNGLWEAFKKIGGIYNTLGPAGQLIANALPGGNLAALAGNLQNNPVSAPSQYPVGNGVLAAPQTNQNVQQQTSINVMGSSDANAIGKAVAGEQSRVNFDMVRNLKGATR